MCATQDGDIMKVIIQYFPIENESGRHNAHSNQDLSNSYNGMEDSPHASTNNNNTIFKFVLFLLKCYYY
jgi:hypothetical protein